MGYKINKISGPGNLFYLLLFQFLVFFACNKQSAEECVKIAPPEELYGDLFFAVQNSNIFNDSKTFVDCIPIHSKDVILQSYSEQRLLPGFDLKSFVYDNFIEPVAKNVPIEDSLSIKDHIQSLWPLLTRIPDSIMSGTLLPLPNSYVIPGGRFREVYYWDSYFTMLGLQEDNQLGLIRNILDNFAFLISKYGHIPNGNRTYYLTRSQPPFFCLMVDLYSKETSDSAYLHYLPSLVQEYEFWMKGIDSLQQGAVSACKRLVKMPDGEILNRYWDESSKPRAESYKEDRNTVRNALLLDRNVDTVKLYRDLRAAAESGWDFSSRWLDKDSLGIYSLTSIHTTDIVPVDLNCLLYYYEEKLSFVYSLKKDKEHMELYRDKSIRRKDAILKYFWNEDLGFFMDYDWCKEKYNEVYSLAGIYPCFFSIATDNQAYIVADRIKKLFMRNGGVVTTLYNTKQQWDYPNGWAPLQWITIAGLRNYNKDSLANVIKHRWLDLNKKVYKNTHKMMEKYNVVDTTLTSGGGEYPTQDGFGWTNGVYQNLSKK